MWADLTEWSQASDIESSFELLISFFFLLFCCRILFMIIYLIFKILSLLNNNKIMKTYYDYDIFIWKECRFSEQK